MARKRCSQECVRSTTHRLVVRADDLNVELGQDAKPLFHRRPRLDLEGHVAGRFRHAESLDEIAVEEGSDPVNQRGIGRGAPGEDPAQVGKLQRLDAAGLAHQLKHRRHELDDGDMLVGQELAFSSKRSWFSWKMWRAPRSSAIHTKAASPTWNIGPK